MLLFVREFFHHKKQTGSIWPSSPQLARAMTKTLRKPRSPLRILEVGPGTGPVTKQILGALRPGDELHIVEINRLFCDQLERKLLRPFQARHPSIAVRMHCAPIEEADLDGPFDLIICSLPFNNFPPALVRSIFRQMMELLAPGGELVYFEYVGVRALKSRFVNETGRVRLRQLSATVRVLRRRHSGRRELVLGNFPPAYAMRLTRR